MSGSTATGYNKGLGILELEKPQIKSSKDYGGRNT